MTATQFVGYARKALVAAAAALGVLAVALATGSEAGPSVSVAEWVQVLIAALGAVGVYMTPNDRAGAAE